MLYNGNMKTRTKGKTKKEREIEKALKEIIITKKEGARGDALKELLKMRYGKEWKKAYIKV